MTPLSGIVRNGIIEVSAPSGLAEGSEVMLFLVQSHPNDDNDSPLAPEEIDRTLKAMELFEAQFPIDENGADLSCRGRDSNEWEKANFEARAEKLRRMVD